MILAMYITSCLVITQAFALDLFFGNVRVLGRGIGAHQQRVRPVRIVRF